MVRYAFDLEMEGRHVVEQARFHEVVGVGARLRAMPGREHLDSVSVAAKRIARVLWNDPATGVMRHADAGYEIAVAVARGKRLGLLWVWLAAASYLNLETIANLADCEWSAR